MAIQSSVPDAKGGLCYLYLSLYLHTLAWLTGGAEQMCSRMNGKWQGLPLAPENSNKNDQDQNPIVVRVAKLDLGSLYWMLLSLCQPALHAKFSCGHFFFDDVMS